MENYTFKSLHYLIKHIDIYLLKTMRAAELINLMMNLVIYPCLVIMYTIVEQCLIDRFFMQSVNNLKEERYCIYN
jgi:hypothetical protein